MSFPRYPAYKDSGVEWLGQVPTHWRVIPLGRLTLSRCDGPFGSGLKSEHYADAGVRVVRLQNIQREGFDGADEAFIDDDYYARELSGHDVRGGDVLIAGLGDDKNTVGRACIAPIGLEPAMVKADCFRFRLDTTQACSEFVVSALNASAAADAGVLSSGSTRSRISLSVMAGIVLVSADFSTEVTTAVLWLNKQGLEITCVRLRPYRLGADVLIDATQIIPLPESADYAVKLRAQEQEKRKVLGARQEVFRKFWAQLIERSKPRTQLLANRSTTSDHWLSAGIGRSGFSLSATLLKNSAHVECYIRPGDEAKSTAAFQALRARKDEIEKTFGGALDWQELPGRLGCRIDKELPGGWTSPEGDWPEIQDRMIDALIQAEAALKQPIQALQV